jgi:putative transposase
MGRTRHEILRIRESRDHPVGRAIGPASQTHTGELGIPRATFYRWFYQSGGPEALDDRSPRPDRVWNRIPDDIRERIVRLALDEPALSPRELAVRFTDTEKYFVSEASVYRLLKAHDLIASPAFIVMKAADEFKDKTTAPNQLWQTDFTYLKVIGWSWFYLSTVLDDFSRYIIAWKLCTTMKAEDVTTTSLKCVCDLAADFALGRRRYRVGDAWSGSAQRRQSCTSQASARFPSR